jgi:phage gpG-like protein
MRVTVKQLKDILGNYHHTIHKAMLYSVNYFGKVLLKRHFTETGAIELKYKPLSIKYRMRKALTHPGKPILVRSGRLRREVTTTAKAYTKSLGNVLLKVKYPRYGAYQRAKGRDFLKVSERDKKLILRHLKNKFKELRRRKPYSNR